MFDIKDMPVSPFNNVMLNVRVDESIYNSLFIEFSVIICNLLFLCLCLHYHIFKCIIFVHNQL